MHLIVRLLVAVGAGLAGWLAFPPTGWWFLAPVAVAGLAAATHDARARTGALMGFVLGVAMFGPMLAWIGVLGPDTVLLLGAMEALFGALLGAASAVVSRVRAWPLVTPMLWVGFELLRSRVPFGGFPWGRLAHSQVDGPLVSYAAVGGMAFLTAVVALVGGGIAWIAVDRRPRHVLVTGCGVGVAVVLGVLLAPPATGGDGDLVTVALVQGNVPGRGMDPLGEARTVTRNHLAATEQLADLVATGALPEPDVVIYPENTTDIDPFNDPETNAVVTEAVGLVGVPSLVGAVLDGPGEDYRRTTGVVWDPRTGPDLDQIYVKRHPVPFGEYIPFREQLLPLIGRLEQVGRQTFAGDEPGVVVLGDLTAGVVICFEIAYDDLTRDVVDGGAEVLVVQSNNASFAGTPQPEQQFAISRLRAVETGRTVLVAATNGISGVITPDGAVVERTEMGTRDVLVHEVERRTDRTLASRLGAWPEWVLTLGGLVAIGLALRSGRLDRRRTSAAAVGPTDHRDEKGRG